MLMTPPAPYGYTPTITQQPSLDYVRDPALYQTHSYQAPQPKQQQSQGGSLPTGLLDKIMGGGQGGANTAGSIVTDSGGWGAGGGIGGGLDALGGSSGAASAGGGLDALGSSSAGAGAGSAGGLAALAPFGYAAAIGVGANTAANHGGTPFGDGLTALMGPSIAQMLKDPKGMGLPTLLGAPFLAPFTASDEAKKTKPEWSGLFGLGF